MPWAELSTSTFFLDESGGTCLPPHCLFPFLGHLNAFFVYYIDFSLYIIGYARSRKTQRDRRLAMNVISAVARILGTLWNGQLYSMTVKSSTDIGYDGSITLSWSPHGQDD